MKRLHGDDASCTTTWWRQESSLSGCRWSRHFSQHLCSGNLTKRIRSKREGVSSAGGHTSSLQHKSSVFLFYHNTWEQRGHLRWRRDESTPHGGEILVFVFFFEQNDCCTPHAGTSHIKGSQTITPLDKHRPLCCYVIISKFVVTEKSSHPWLGWTNPGAHWGVLEQGTYSLPAAVEAQWPTDRSTGGLGGCRRHERPHRCSHVEKCCECVLLVDVTWALSTQRIYSPSHTCGALLLTPPLTLKHPVSAAASGGGCVGHLPGVDEPSVFTPPNSEKFTACQREKQQLTSWTEFQRSCCYRLIFKLASRCWCLLHF